MVDLETIGNGWDEAARADAMFNILTDPNHQNNGWTVDEFFAHGQAEIDQAMARLGELGIKCGAKRALDFGCGIGRLTQALTFYFKHVDGVDISKEMIVLARRHNHGRLCVYHHNTAPDLKLFNTRTFDLVYSMIVLQHMPLSLQQGYVREFFRVLKRGGIAMFEIPDGPEYTHPTPWLSMHGVPRGTVEQWITEAGGTLLDVELIPEPSVWECLRYTASA